MRASFTYTISKPLDGAIAAFRQTAFFVATLKHAGAVTIDILEETDLDDGGRFWRAKITESSRVPEFLRASDVDIYINESTFRPSARTLSWRISPKIQAHRILLEGEIRLVGKGERGTELAYDVDLTVRIPLVGRRLEAYGIRRIGGECAGQAAFLETWSAP